jgi:hypothetical protein
VVSVTGPSTVPVGRFRAYRVEAKDPDGDASQIVWFADGLQLSSRTSRVKLRFSSGGMHELTVAVDDGHGATATSTLHISIIP